MVYEQHEDIKPEEFKRLCGIDKETLSRKATEPILGKRGRLRTLCNKLQGFSIGYKALLNDVTIRC